MTTLKNPKSEQLPLIPSGEELLRSEMSRFASRLDRRLGGKASVRAVVIADNMCGKFGDTLTVQVAWLHEKEGKMMMTTGSFNIELLELEAAADTESYVTSLLDHIEAQILAAEPARVMFIPRPSTPVVQ